jgi:hypothetical protein
MFVLLVFLPIGDLVSETNNHFHVKKIEEHVVFDVFNRREGII